MLNVPMNMPAELHHLGPAAAGHNRVTRAPLVILAYGLRAMEPGRREQFVIRSPLGDLTAIEAEAALRDWHAPRAG